MMKIDDRDIEKIERLCDGWQLEMPEETFFTNLSARVLEKARERERSWWFEVLAPAGVVTVLIIILGLGLGYQASQISRQQRWARAAAQWLSEDMGWEDIDRVLGQAKELNISELHLYFDSHSLVAAAHALESDFQFEGYYDGYYDYDDDINSR